MKILLCLFVCGIFLTACNDGRINSETPVTSGDTVWLPTESEKPCRDSLTTFYHQLSGNYNFRLFFYECPQQNVERHYWKIIIEDKSGSVIDSVRQDAYVLYPTLEELSEYYSCSGKVNTVGEVIDGYYGVFAVCDFNFDGKEDFAILTDLGGNGGAAYSYFIQHPQNHFFRENYLSDTMVYFPNINRSRKTLTTKIHSGVCGLSESEFTLLNAATWKRTKSRLIDICR
ncbi:MAG: hypothetical protein MUC87_10300 [Bacteroidia bacterium]|jgi:hypothetical protein|nr:hypothetical protein [Bacteroidia bacterium]